MGFSKFAILRPKGCVPAGASGTHQDCVTNSGMAKIIGKEEVPSLRHSHTLSKIMCNPPLLSCHLGCCQFCPRKVPLHKTLEDCFEEAGIDQVEFRQRKTTNCVNMGTQQARYLEKREANLQDK